MPDVTPPSDTLAEQSVLASMLLSVDVAKGMSSALSEASFHKHRNRVIFRAVQEMVESDVPVDIITLAGHLRAVGQFEEVGGLEYLTLLFDVTPTAANADYYAAQLMEYEQRRRFALLAENMRRAVEDGGNTAAEMIESAEREILAIAAGRMRTRPLRSMNEVVTNTYNWIEAAHNGKGQLYGIRTGFYDLDNATCGLQPGSLVILAARPSMGKTALALDIVMNAARAADRGLFFSCEMSDRELILRKISAISGVSTPTIRAGRTPDSAWRDIAKACAELSSMPIDIDDTPNQPIADIQAKARRWAAKGQPGVIVVDYLQLLTVQHESGESREQQISTISRKLKGLARETNCPVIALSQLSRRCEQRDDKRPVLSDLRESGAIEQDADVVLFVYRDEVYTGNNRGEAEVIVGKNRNGPLANVKLAWRATATTFANYAPQEAAANDRYQD